MDSFWDNAVNVPTGFLVFLKNVDPYPVRFTGMKKRAKSQSGQSGQSGMNRGEKKNPHPYEEVLYDGGRALFIGFICVGALSCASNRVKPESQEKAEVRARPFSPAFSAEEHFALAQAYITEGNTDLAIAEYRETLKFDPNSPLVYARLATEYLKKGMFSEAKEACKEALQRDPKFTDARLLLAGIYSSSHQTDAAVEEYDRILKSSPTHEEAAVYKAEVLLEGGRSEAAAQALRQFAKKNRDSAVAYFYLGKVEQELRHFKQAEAAYRKAIQIRSNFNQAVLALALLYEENKMNSQAIATYKELYRETQDLAAADRLATIYLKEEKYQLAIPYLEAMAESDPSDLNTRVKLGLIQMEIKQYPQAIHTFKSILEKNPDSDRVNYYLGNIYEELKDRELAAQYLQKIKPDSKLYADAVLHSAILMKESGKVQEVKAYIKDVIERSPGFVNFYIFQASLEEESKDLNEAIRILELAVKKFNEDERVRYYLGNLYDRIGEAQKGIEQMEAILKVNPNHVDALNHVGYSWTTQGIRLNEAEVLLKRALELRPNNGFIKDSWGWYLFVRGRLEEAVLELEMAVSLNPHESTILEHLADAYLHSNRFDKALVRYKDAVKYADSEEAKKKLENKVNDLQTSLAQKNSTEKNGSPTRMPASNSRK